MKINGFYSSVNGDCDSLKGLVAQGPTVAVIDARIWQFYCKIRLCLKSLVEGVLNYEATDFNHAALIVAYDKDEWILKNSWGSDWGDGGFIRLKAGNTCGICN
jgi:aminopeptidase C